MIETLPKPPVLVDRVLDDRDTAWRLVEANSPYWPVQRYSQNAAQGTVIGDPTAKGRPDDAPPVVAPVFRGDWAYDVPLIDGVEVFLHNDRLIDAAKRLFDSELVRPRIVYANLTWQLPFPQGPGHRDVPEFRGINRTEYPVWLLLLMGHSGLFTSHQIQIATAVAWYYRGADGGLDYWPDGPDQPPRAHEGAIDNTAIVGDNDWMFHRVRPVGDPARGLLGGMDLESRLVHRGGDQWAIEAGDGRELATMTTPEVRVSISWKASVFVDAADARRYDEHTDDLTYQDVLDRFGSDLAARGIDAAGRDPLTDPGFARLLAETYVTEPA